MYYGSVCEERQRMEVIWRGEQGRNAEQKERKRRRSGGRNILRNSECLSLIARSSYSA
jgi:hypothetical protein